MKILLVYPEFTDTFWSFKHALKFIRKKAGAPPLGLLTVAAMLPSEWQKRLVDLNITSLTEEDLAWADYVFVSAMVVQRESVRAILQRCKTAGVRVVAGGPLFTMEHERPVQDHRLDQLTVAEAMDTDKVKIRVAIADVDSFIENGSAGKFTISWRLRSAEPLLERTQPIEGQTYRSSP